MDFSCLVSNLNGANTIKLEGRLTTANNNIKEPPLELMYIIDTGAERTSFTKQLLHRHGYGKFMKYQTPIYTAMGPTAINLCDVNGFKLANQFEFGKLRVGVLENWKEHAVVGVIGMDILSQLTFIMSHEHKKFLLTDKSIRELTDVLKPVN